jgi:2-(1,2-epoxy-1,2-dihydrophenyl)acetyl-CoA isomerase
MTLTVSDDGLARVVFTDAARGNPIDGPFSEALDTISIELSDRDDVRAVLLTAEGRAFSYGGDISEYVGKLDGLSASVRKGGGILQVAIARLQRMDAPIVAGVHGVCAGGMVGLIAGSDLLVASTNAKFVAAYAGIGLCPDAGATAMLTRRMGAARTRRFLLMNETLKATSALEAGLVDEVVELDQVGERAAQIAVQLAAGPTRAFGEVRRLLLVATQTGLETQLELETQAAARNANTADAREGLTAFAEKRPPSFQGS